MATTQQKTDLMTNITATPPVLNKRSADGGPMTVKMCYHTQVGTGDAGSTIDICRMPAGARIYLQESKVRVTAYGAARTMHIGNRAYTKPDGTVVAEDNDSINVSGDVSAAVVTRLIQFGTLGVAVALNDTAVFDGQVDLFATVNVSTIPAAAVTVFQIVYSLGD